VRVGTLARLATAVLAASLIVAACGGGNSGDPTATVKDFVSLVEQKQFDKIPDIACAAQKDAMKEQFDIGGQLAGSLEGVDAKSITDAMTIKFDNLEAQRSRSPPTGEGLGGDLKMSVDKTKMTDLVKKAPAAQTCRWTMLPWRYAGLMVGAFEQGEPVDSSVDLVVENGKWVVCGHPVATRH
jgi:hypothetical protein